jgi:hypothetical protein
MAIHRIFIGRASDDHLMTAGQLIGRIKRYQ